MEKSEKKKKRKLPKNKETGYFYDYGKLPKTWFFAPFYGAGDGTSGATMPRFSTATYGSPSPGPAWPNAQGINSPSVPPPPPPNFGMGPVVASKDVDDMFKCLEKLDEEYGRF